MCRADSPEYAFSDILVLDARLRVADTPSPALRAACSGRLRLRSCTSGVRECIVITEEFARIMHHSFTPADETNLRLEIENINRRLRIQEIARYPEIDGSNEVAC